MMALLFCCATVVAAAMAPDVSPIRLVAEDIGPNAIPRSLMVFHAVPITLKARQPPDLVLSGRYIGDERPFVRWIRNQHGRFRSAGELLQGLDVASLSAVDIDKDGRQEALVIGQRGASRKASGKALLLRLKDGQLASEQLPINALLSPIVAWLDYDADGWTDLVYGGYLDYGNVQEAGSYVWKFPCIWRNDHGRLRRTDEVFKVRAEKAWTIDYNDDGKDDLFFTTSPGGNGASLCNRLFLNLGGRFEELATPLLGLDKLAGVHRADVRYIDFDGDGLRDLLITGTRNGQLGSWAGLSLVYQKLFYKRIDRYWLQYYKSRNGDLPFRSIAGRFLMCRVDPDGTTALFLSGLQDGQWLFQTFLKTPSRQAFVSVDASAWLTGTSLTMKDVLFWGRPISIDVDGDRRDEIMMLGGRGKLLRFIRN